MFGYRVTDAVEYYKHRGEDRFAVRAVRSRHPDKFRWRAAVSNLTHGIGRLRGLERVRLEEPVREMVLDLDDPLLRREVVLDARRYHVDLDRGDVLPHRTMGELRRVTFLAGTDVDLVRKHVALPDDFEASIDVAGVVLVGRALAEQYRRRAHHYYLAVPTPEDGARLTARQRAMLEQSELDALDSKRWAAVSRSLLGESAKA